MTEQDKPYEKVTTNKQEHTAEYVASFEACPESTIPWRYYVMFRQGHTPEAHARAIGEKGIALEAPHPIGP